MVRTWSRPYGLSHCPYTKAHIKGFGSPYLHVYACLLLCFMHVLAFLVLGFATLDALCGVCGCMVTFDAHEALFGCKHLGCITMMLVALGIPFPLSAPCDDMLATCLFMTPVGFLCIFTHLITCPCMSLVCHPCFNTMKLWTFDPNLHLSLADTTCCLLSYLFAFLLVLAFLLLCLPCLSCLSTLCLIHMLYASLSFHCLSVGFLSLPLHVHTWS